MSEAIIKAKLLEWLESKVNDASWGVNHRYAFGIVLWTIQSGTFDLSPTDVDVKEIEEAITAFIGANNVFPRQSNKEGGWTINPNYLDEVSDRDAVDPSERPSLEQIEMILLAIEPDIKEKLAEYESTIGELDAAHRMMHERNERLEKELQDAKAKIAVLERDNDMLESAFAEKEAEYEECKADALGLHKQLGEAVEAVEQLTKYEKWIAVTSDSKVIKSIGEYASKALQSIKGGEANEESR